MSGALPSTDKFQAINIKSNQKTLISQTASGKTFRRQVQNQRWSFTANYSNISRPDFAPIQAFIIKQRGSKEDFTITLPSYLNAQGNETGSVLVNGAHSLGDTTIAMDAFASDGAGRFKAGDFIKFNAHSKVYMVVEDVTSSSNAATVTIEPPLQNTLSDNEAVIYDSVPFTVHLRGNVQEFPSNLIDFNGNLLCNFEFDVIESI